MWFKRHFKNVSFALAGGISEGTGSYGVKGKRLYNRRQLVSSYLHLVSVYYIAWSVVVDTNALYLHFLISRQLKLASLRSRRRPYPPETSIDSPLAVPPPPSSLATTVSALSSSLTASLELDTMSCRDRTSEFGSIVRSLQSVPVSQ